MADLSSPQSNRAKSGDGGIPPCMGCSSQRNTLGDNKSLRDVNPSIGTGKEINQLDIILAELEIQCLYQEFLRFRLEQSYPRVDVPLFHKLAETDFIVVT